jgi:hypothetical protein
MTIGIAVKGPNAGLAAFQALAAVERVARGAIGGFVSFVAITEGGTLLRAETQRGGTGTLFTEGERTGVGPPAAVAAAPIAGLMSSGPDRPAPLIQFTPALPTVGLVTGHRLPNIPGEDGVALNRAVLARMQAGEPAETAVRTVLDRNPGAEAGIIALAIDGHVFAGNSLHVQTRGDLGRALVIEPAIGAAIAVLYNAMHPKGALADLAASTALDVMAPADRQDFCIQVQAGTALEVGDENTVHVDADGRAVRISVTTESWLGKRRDGAVIDFAAKVRQNGRLVGRTIAEPYCVVENGRLVSMSGRDLVTIGVRASAKADSS